MELRHLRYYVAVAESLHFTRAAEKLRIAQPALSQQIRSLEEELGVRLLDRTNRRVSLTHAGGVYLEEARRILSATQHAGTLAAQAARGEVGRLNIGYVLSSTGRPLTRTLREFQQAQPRVGLVLHDLSEDEQWRELVDGNLDIALTRTAPENDAIARMVIERQRLTILLPTGHPMAKPREISLRDLAGESFIMGRGGTATGYNHFLYTLCRQAGFEPRVRQFVRDLPSILWMVSAGIGVGFSPSGIDPLYRSGVVARPLKPKILTNVWLQWRKDDSSPVLKQFLTTVQKTVNAGREASR
jgi:DNA-binding transcriptional LysR family regulator